MPCLNLDADHVIKRYLSGISANKLSQELGVSAKAIRNCLLRAGVALRSNCNVIDYATVVNLYRSGMSENQIALQLGVSRTCIRQRLIKAGVTPRSQSEAETLKWSQMTAEQRRNQVAAANEACRGRVHSEQERIKRAEVVYRRQLRISHNEQRVAQVLRAHGFSVEQQFPIHTCNIDIAVHPGPIAVEIHGGGWHATPFHRRLLSQKREQLFSRDWALVEFWVDNRCPFDLATNELITLLEQLGRLPSVAGEHWMVLGNRKHPVAVRADGDDVAGVVAPHGSGNDAGLDLGVA
jgi:transposase